MQALNTGDYKTSCRVKGENRAVALTFGAHKLDKAVKLYNLTALYQFGEQALINFQNKLGKYLEMLETKETDAKIKLFLARREKTSIF